jgi:hypothetical protein
MYSVRLIVFEGEEVAIHHIVRNVKYWAALIEDRCAIHQISIDLPLHAVYVLGMIFDSIGLKYGLKTLGIGSMPIVGSKITLMKWPGDAYS